MCPYGTQKKMRRGVPKSLKSIVPIFSLAVVLLENSSEGVTAFVNGYNLS